MFKKLEKYLFYCLAFILIFISGCLEPIELDIPKGFQQTIILEGKIVKGEPSTFELRVSQLFSFTAESRGSINARDAIIIDDAGNEMTIKATGQGIYFYEFTDIDPIKIDFGRSYKIRIGTFDGREFESAFEPLAPVPEINNLKLEKIEKEIIFPDQTTRLDTFIRYKVDTDLIPTNSNEKSRLRWELQNVYRVTDVAIFDDEPKTCYLSSDLDVPSIKILNGSIQASNSIEDFVLYDELISPNFAEGLYFTAIQESLSESAFEYWERVKAVVDREGDIFADPPGKVKSNFVNINDPDDEAFGYFYVTQQDTARVFVSPEFAGNPSNRCPSMNMFNPDGSCADLLCCDCLTDPTSTTIKPDFWIF